MLRGRDGFAGSQSFHQGVPRVLMTPSVARGVTPFLPLRGLSSALGEEHSMCRWRRSRRWQGRSAGEAHLVREPGESSVSCGARRRVCYEKSEHSKSPRPRLGANGHAR